MEPKLKAPFPYFGGKRSIASLVWSRLGEVSNYIEPFAGSCAVLLGRPAPFNGVETINDVNAYVTNFWRATSRDPEAIVAACDWPVSELDLHARHRWLVLSPEAIAFRERLRSDPDYFDAKIAGWWVWGACCWIGGEWCRYTDGPGRRPTLSGEGEGVHGGPVEWEQLPDITSARDLGKGVHSDAAHKRKKPRTEGDNKGSSGKGVHAAGQQKRPRVEATMAGVNGSVGPSEQLPRMGARYGMPDLPGVLQPGGRPQLGDAYDVGRGVNGNGDAGTCAQRREWLLDWFHRLQDRLRLVRVCCGHWLRVCDSDSVTTRLGTVGLFLDPPYPVNRKAGGRSRSKGLYQGDNSNSLDKLRDEILAYCTERGGNHDYRVALCCYEGDGYEPLAALGWDAVSWESQGGYANAGANKANKKRERIYFSPHCIREQSLFDALGDADAT